MIPEFSVKQIDSKLSSDFLAHVCLWTIVTSMIVYYILTKGYQSSNAFLFALPLSIVLFQSLTPYLPFTKNNKAFQSGGMAALSIYNAAIASMLIWFLPLYSPFILIVPAVMYITIYYRGTPAFIISLVFLVLLVCIATLRNGVPQIAFGEYYPLLAITLGAVFAGIVQRASSIDEAIRLEFNRVSQRVELEREQLSSLIDSMSDTVMATNREGVILFHNKSALTLLGKTDLLNGKKIIDLVTLYNPQNQPVDFLVLAKKENKDLNFDDLHFNSKSNEKVDVYLDIASIQSKYIQNQQEEGFIIILRDITKDKTIEEERDAFTSVASHELRTPIAVAEAGVSMLMSSVLTDKFDQKDKEMVERVYDSITSLSRLINDLDMVSNAEQKLLNASVEAVNIANLLDDLAKEYSNEVSMKKLEISVEAQSALPTIYTSHTYLHQILQNLIINSIKYTEQGKITLSAFRSGHGEIIISVKDTGIGIGTSDKPKIFNKFYRSEDFRTRKTSGTGLGLYISLKLTEYLHGKIWFESELNKGSTFYLEIPSSTTIG